MASQKKIVTLNVGSQRVGMGVFSPAPGGGLVVHDYQFSELLGDPAAESARIPQITVAVNELVQRMGVKGQAVRYAISGHSVFTRFVKLPSLDEDKVDQIVEFEAQQNVPFPIDEVVWDYQLVGSDSSEVEVVLVAIKSDSLNEINDAVEESSLVTQTVDVAPMALYNAFRYCYGDLAEPAMLVDVGARTTNIVYMHGPRVFTRSVPVGGTAASSAIAKEFDISFAEAEAIKIRDGFVSLGGSYADHEDPAIASMSKIIRNTMTRLHAEVVRTTSAFRQQGGSAPKIAYLCGGSAGLPYLREFFNEKLNIPVEYFNPLLNVSVGPKVQADEIGKEAHTLGELVGMALRGVAACPMEIDLVPEKVEARKDLARRKPFLITAGICLLSALAALGLHFTKGASLTREQLSTLRIEQNTLGGFNSKIEAEDTALTEARLRALPLRTAVKGRTLMLDLVSYLNSKLASDRLWITQFEVLSKGAPLPDFKPLFQEGVADRIFGTPEPVKPKFDRNAPVEIPMIDSIRFYGLYRDDVANVFQFETALRADPQFFALTESEPPRDEILQVKTGNSEVVWAEMFRFDLPLAKALPIK
jgi:type IV pilus assembly protein PilM